MKNNLKKILISRGFRQFKMTDECLVQTNVLTTKRFNKILNNVVPMNQDEIEGIARWFKIHPDDLINYSDEVKKIRRIHEQSEA